MHRKLISEIVHKGKPSDMECLADIMEDMIDDLKYTEHHKYKAIEHKLHTLVYGEHLSEYLAHHWVSHMENKDGTHGEHWTMDQTNQFAGNHNHCDWYAVMNMIYSDYYNPKFDTNTYVELAHDWINDADVGEGKTLKYYLYVVCEEE